MLALAHPPPEGWAVADSHSDSPGGSILPVKATLVVVPASLLDQWKEETKRHVAPGGLELLHYPGIKGVARRRLEEKGAAGGPSWDFEKYDIILTSYEVGWWL
jgi:SNF2 family DNA or RNA helicase